MKPLEALSRLANDHEISYIENNFSITEDYELIQKSLKAFEIIKVKGLNENEILMIKSNYSYEQYKETTIELYGYGFSEYAHLLKTREEYELLKEVMK